MSDGVFTVVKYPEGLPAYYVDTEDKVLKIEFIVRVSDNAPQAFASSKDEPFRYFCCDADAVFSESLFMTAEAAAASVDGLSLQQEAAE